jgi:hypothetical protein
MLRITEKFEDAHCTAGITAQHVTSINNIYRRLILISLKAAGINNMKRTVGLIRYLGDGVYAEYEPCSANFILRTGSHKNDEADNYIALEPAILRALIKYAQQINDLEEQAAKEAAEE